MKKWLCLALMLLSLCTVLSAVAVTNEDDLDTIKRYYQEATSEIIDGELVEGQPDLDKARENLENLVKFYDANKDTLSNAQLMYKYAKGRLAIMNGDYQSALLYLGECGTFGYNVSAYYSFARGMALSASDDKRTDYPEAINLLMSVQDNEEFMETCISTIASCKASYKAFMLKQAGALMDKAKYTSAMDYYTELKDIFVDDSEVKSAYNKCKALIDNEEIPTAYVIEIKNPYATGSNSVCLQWDGTADSYTVLYSMTSKADDDSCESITTTEKKCTVTGLLPGTQYFFRVKGTNDSTSGEIMVKTYDTQSYNELNDAFQWTQSFTAYRFDKKRASFLASGIPSYQYKETLKCKSIKDKSIDLHSSSIQNSCMLYVFTTLSMAEDMVGEPYKLLLHVEDQGTLVKEGVFGDVDACTDAGKVYVLVYDLLDKAVDTWPELTDKTYTVDLLMNDALVVRATGTLK